MQLMIYGSVLIFVKFTFINIKKIKVQTLEKYISDAKEIEIQYTQILYLP